MSNYVNRFTRILVEKDEEMTDQEAMASTLDKDTNPADLNVQDVPPVGAQPQPTLSGMQKQMYDELKGWTAKIDDFTKFLNSTEPSSVQSKLNSAESDTLFDKIATAETKKIARVAAELTSFNEQLKGYLASAHDPKYRYS